MKRDLKRLIRFLAIALTLSFTVCSTALAQSLTHDEVRTILKLESSYRACLEENDILRSKESAYLSKIELRQAQLKNQDEILNKSGKIILNLEQDIIKHRGVIDKQNKEIRLLKTGMYISLGLIPIAFVAGAIRLP